MVVDLLEVNLLHPAIGGLGRPISLLSLDGLALDDRAKTLQSCATVLPNT
jgi:hypothetical protein